MVKSFCYLAVFVLVAIFPLHELSAQVAGPEKRTCLEQAAEKIRPNSKVTVVKLNGEEQSGLLDSIGLGNSHLLLKGLRDYTLSLYRQEEIAKIQYYERGKLKPGYMVMGFLLGTAVGFFVGYAIGSSGDKDIGGGLGALFAGTGVGAGTGLLLGTIIPAVSHSTQTIECK